MGHACDAPPLTLVIVPGLFKSAAKFQRHRMRIRLRAALYRCFGGYNFRELTAQHEKCNAAPMSEKDNCDTRLLLLILKIGALDYIDRFLPYLNREQETRREAREGAIHPKIASPTASGGRSPRLLMRSWSRWYPLGEPR
jgi:hypothetical protein